MGHAIQEAMELQTSAKRTERSAGLALVERWRGSGQSVTEFCRGNGIPTHRLHYWKKQAEGLGGNADVAAREFCALAVRDPSVSLTSSTPDAASAEPLEIAIGASICIRLPSGATREAFIQTLRWVIEAIDA